MNKYIPCTKITILLGDGMSGGGTIIQNLSLSHGTIVQISTS
jgi:hypothetical protein